MDEIALSPSALRMIRDITNISKDSYIMNEGCKVKSIMTDPIELDEGFMALIKLKLTAVHDSPYQGNKYVVNLHVPNDYPFRPPIVVFETPINHINVTEKGRVIHALLTTEWSPIGLTPLIMALLLMFTEERAQDLMF